MMYLQWRFKHGFRIYWHVCFVLSNIVVLTAGQTSMPARTFVLTPGLPMVREGGNITLSCSTNTNDGFETVQWIRDGKVMASQSQFCDPSELMNKALGQPTTDVSTVTHAPRYSATCHNQSHFSLTLVSVMRAEQNNEWQCIGQGLGNVTVYESNRVHLTVLVEPSATTISDTSVSANGTVEMLSRPGQQTTLECVSRAVYPPPGVFWFKVVRGLNPAPLQTNYSVSGIVNGTVTITSRYTFTTELEDDRATYFCRLVYPYTNPLRGILEDFAVDIRLAVQPHFPVIYYACAAGSGPMTATTGCIGRELTLECVSRNGYPRQTVKWYRGNNSGASLTSEETVSKVNGTFTVWSRFTLSPSPTHSDVIATYICCSSTNTRENDDMGFVDCVKLRLKDDVVGSVGMVVGQESATEEKSMKLLGGLLGGTVLAIALVVCLVWTTAKRIKANSTTEDKAGQNNGSHYIRTISTQTGNMPMYEYILDEPSELIDHAGNHQINDEQMALPTPHKSASSSSNGSVYSYVGHSQVFQAETPTGVQVNVAIDGYLEGVPRENHVISTDHEYLELDADMPCIHCTALKLCNTSKHTDRAQSHLA